MQCEGQGEPEQRMEAAIENPDIEYLWIDLGIISFATGTDHPPPLGVPNAPDIQFQTDLTKCLPFASTCGLASYPGPSHPERKGLLAHARDNCETNSKRRWTLPYLFVFNIHMHACMTVRFCHALLKMLNCLQIYKVSMLTVCI